MQHIQRFQDINKNYLLIRGVNRTITKISWMILRHTIHKTIVSGYQYKTTQECNMVKAITKSRISDQEYPILLLINNSTLINDP